MTECLSTDQLRAFLSDSLPAAEMQTYSAHINRCAACQEAADREADDSVLCREYRDQSIEPLADTALSLLDSIPSAEASTLPFVKELPDDQPVPHPSASHKLGRYKLRRLIARGGFGEVWEAFDPALKRAVAIKMVRRDRRLPGPYQRGFQEEGQKLASLRHSGIVDVYDVVEHDNQVFIVTELLSGGTLATRLKQSPITFQDAVRVLAKVARAAHAAHRAGLVHRDIKPANIVLDADGEPRLSDFGLAADTEDQSLESPGAIGTIPYMSPEQASGQNQLLDARSDIYSLGVVLYQMLTGHLPQHGNFVDELRQKIQTEQPPPPREVNPAVPFELEQVCMRCLRKAADERFSTALELAESLEAWLQKSSSASGTPSVFADNVFDETTKLIESPSDKLNRPVFSSRLLRNAFGWQGLILLTSLTGLGLGVVLELRPGNFSSAPRIERSVPNVTVRVLTKPAGAKVVVYPLEKRFGLPDGMRRVEGATISPAELRLAPGFYLVVAALEEGRFHEVYRTVPESLDERPKAYPHLGWNRVGELLEWPEIVIPDRAVTDGMARFASDPKFGVGRPDDATIPLHPRQVPAFFLDSHETTVVEYRAAYRNQLPPSLARLKDQAPPGDFPISGIWWDDAVKYAERIGKRLPSEVEYEFAATAGGTQQFPWGDAADIIASWPLGPVRQPDFDRLEMGTTIHGLYSNVPEWTSSPVAPYPHILVVDDHAPLVDPENYIVRGGPRSVIDGKPDRKEFGEGPRARNGQHHKSLGHAIGFRCARSVKPRLESTDLEAVLTESPANPLSTRIEGF